MRCPSLNELPAPPTGKTGWPWNEEVAQIESSPPGGGDWPCLSLVSTCLNRAEYIEESIRSALLQGYPNIDFVIIDGGSTDGTVAIIEKYRPWISSFVSEPDDGPGFAANKAFKLIKGDRMVYVLSDDSLLPGALEAVGRHHVEHPEALLVADIVIHDQATGEERVAEQNAFNLKHLVEFWKDEKGAAFWSGIGILIPVPLLKEMGGYDVSLRYASDAEMNIRLLSRTSAVYIHETIARFRVHAGSLTMGETKDVALAESVVVTRRHRRLVRDFDSAGFREYCRGLAPHVFHYGMQRVKRRQRGGLKSLFAAFRLGPIAAVAPSIRAFFRRFSRSGGSGS